MGNTIETYIRSLEFFLKFIHKGLLYNMDILDQRQKLIILGLRERLPDYRSTIHRRTAHQVTTRKVDEAFSRLVPSDIRQVEASDQSKRKERILFARGPSANLSHKARLSRMHHKEWERRLDNLGLLNILESLTDLPSTSCASTPFCIPKKN